MESPQALQLAFVLLWGYYFAFPACMAALILATAEKRFSLLTSAWRVCATVFTTPVCLLLGPILAVNSLAEEMRKARTDYLRIVNGKVRKSHLKSIRESHGFDDDYLPPDSRKF